MLAAARLPAGGVHVPFSCRCDDAAQNASGIGKLRRQHQRDAHELGLFCLWQGLHHTN